MNTTTYNNYSEKLLSYMPKATIHNPIRFRVSNTYFDRVMGKQVVPTSTMIKPIDRIFDPGHDKEIDIAYITGSRPLGPNSARAEEILLGEIVFSRNNFGMYEWDGNKQQEALAQYLFFSNSNGSNVGKPWYLGGTVQYIVLGDDGAKEKLGSEVLVDRAKAKLSSMTNEALSQLCMAWFPQDYESLTPEQLMLRLRSIAEKDPNKVLNMSDSGELSVMASINSFVKEGLIRLDEASGSWLFKDGTMLVGIKGDEAPYLAIKKFLATDVGQKVYILLEEELMEIKK